MFDIAIYFQMHFKNSRQESPLDSNASILKNIIKKEKFSDTKIYTKGNGCAKRNITDVSNYQISWINVYLK